MADPDERDMCAAAAFELAPVGLARVGGSEPAFVAANAAYRELLGVEDDLVGRDARAVLRDGSGAQLARLARVLATGRAESLRQRHAGGDLYEVTITPVRDPGGAVVGADLVARRWELAERAAREAVLVPDGVVVHPSWAVSGSTALAASAQPGSDWFDSLALPDGRLALVLGDVAGRGPAAVGTASRLRAALMLALTEEPHPGRALERTARLVRHVPEAVGTTVLVVVAEPSGERVRYASAGHPAPLHVTTRGEVTPLAESGGACFGVEGKFPVETARLDPGDVLLLMTDGVLRAAGGLLDEAVGRVGDLAADVLRGCVDDLDGAEAICHEVLHEIAPAGATDDAVLLAVRRRAWPAEPLAMTLPALPDTVAVVRHELVDWLDAAGIGAVDASSILQASAELVANAVEHAYPPGTDHRDTELTVSCGMEPDGVVDLRITDTGRWLEDARPREESDTFGVGGRGLYLARAFVDDLVVTRSEHGTSCQVRHRPLRPVTVLAADARHPGWDDRTADFDVTVEGSVLVVSGAVDLPAADRLRLAIGRASQGATRPVEVDVSRTTLLTSSAISALIDAGVADASGLVTVRADPGTPADLVLRRVGLRGD